MKLTNDYFNEPFKPTNDYDCYGIIYLIENLVNGKKYVGQTIFNLNKRISKHKDYKSTRGCPYIQSAIHEYGFINFQVSILHFAYSRLELDELEVLTIDKLNSMSPNGYNLSTGGSFGRPSKESNEKNRQSQLGRKHSDETKLKMSQSRQNRITTEATRDKLSYFHRIKPPKNKSGYKGVSRTSDGYSWQSTCRLTIDRKNKNIFIGSFKNAEDAAKAYDDFMFKLYGFDCYLNFPERLQNYEK